MSRVIEYSKALTVNLGPVERAIVAYYAYRSRKSKGDVVRGMIERYARYDRLFDPDAFLEFVSSAHFDPETKDDEDAKGTRFAAELFADRVRAK